MFVDSNVVLLRQPDMTAGSTNNPPTFDDDIAAVLAQGTLCVSWERIKHAIHDPRLVRHHLKVLAELLDCLNAKAGTAWPSRETLAERCGLNVRTVQNVLYDLRKYHYVTWEKRPSEVGKRLVHYTVPLTTADADFLRNEINRYVNNFARSTMQKSCTPGSAKAANARSAMQKSARPTVQKVARPTVQQEPTYELTKEKKVKSASPTAQPRGSRLSETWVLPKAWGEWTLEQFDASPDQIRRQAQTFKDYWLAKAGKQAIKLDWFATWRNWCGSDYTKWRRRKAMTSKIAPDLLDVARPEDEAYVAELKRMKALQLRGSDD